MCEDYVHTIYYFIQEIWTSVGVGTYRRVLKQMIRGYGGKAKHTHMFTHKSHSNDPRIWRDTNTHMFTHTHTHLTQMIHAYGGRAKHTHVHTNTFLTQF